MRVGISSASFFNTCALEDAPLRIKTLGADICEVFFNTYSEYDPDFVGMLHERVMEAGLEVYSIHPMGTQFEPQLFSLHPRQRADAERIFESVLTAGKRLHARYYVMHGPAGQYGALKNMSMERVGPITHALSDMAAAYGLKLAWENVSWCLFSRPDFCPRLLDASKCDDMRFTLDIKQAVRSGYAPLEYIQAMGGRLVNLHVCDYAIVDGGMRPMLPGKGACDLRALRRELDMAGYAGPAFLEVYSDLYRGDDMLRESYLYVKRNLGGMYENAAP